MNINPFRARSDGDGKQPTSRQLPLWDRKADNMASKLGSLSQVEAVTTRDVSPSLQYLKSSYEELSTVSKASPLQFR